MNASDIMSSPVLSVDPATPVLQVAALLQERRIGGVPVLADRELVGIVTETDLLHRRELGTQRRNLSSAWWRRVMQPHLAPAWYIKSHGRCARHVMTRGVVVVEPRTSLPEITRLFDKHGIGRVPVVQDRRVIGIVASADLVRALSRGAGLPAAAPHLPGDDGIRAALLAELRHQPWWNASIVAVEVTGGVVRFTGFYDNDAQRRASLVAAENIRGVRDVQDERHPMAEFAGMV